MSIRDATHNDLGRINDLYNSTVLDSHISFDIESWTLEDREQWWEDRDPELVCLVAAVSEEVVGVAYSTWWRSKEAYRTTMETTVILSDSFHEQGLGTELLTGLTERLRDEGVHRALAIIALPNEASVALHRKLGYRDVGVLSEVGNKLGKYWDTVLMEKDLGSP